MQTRQLLKRKREICRDSLSEVGACAIPAKILEWKNRNYRRRPRAAAHARHEKSAEQNHGGDTGTATGTGKGTGTAGTSNSGTPESAATDDASSHESAACQMGHAPASTGALSLLAMLGALFGLKRRRAQR